MLGVAMAKPLPLPTEATALGMLAELLRRRAPVSQRASGAPSGAGQADPVGVVGARPIQGGEPDGGSRTDVLDVYAEHESFRVQGRAAAQQAASRARAVAHLNAERAQVLLQRGKLQQRMALLRREQAQAATPELARQLRRQRAELAVEAEGYDVQLARHDAGLEVARTQLRQAHADAEAAERGGRDSHARLLSLQRAAAPLGASFAALEVAFGVAACRAFLAKDARAGAIGWGAEAAAASDATRALHVQMRRGRFAKDDVDAAMGGRATATGEALCALVVVGELDAARQLFAEACPTGEFFHQIYPVFRAYSFGLYLSGDHTALAEAVRLHRWTQGSRGALAESFWQLLHGDAAALGSALVQLVVQDWRTWSLAPTPAMGLVCTTACALARLARVRGLALPAPPGSTTPAALWAAGAQAP